MSLLLRRLRRGGATPALSPTLLAALVLGFQIGRGSPPVTPWRGGAVGSFGAAARVSPGEGSPAGLSPPRPADSAGRAWWRRSGGDSPVPAGVPPGAPPTGIVPEVRAARRVHPPRGPLDGTAPRSPQAIGGGGEAVAGSMGPGHAPGGLLRAAPAAAQGSHRAARGWWSTTGAPSAACVPPWAAGAQVQARQATASDGGPSNRAQPAAAPASPALTAGGLLRATPAAAKAPQRGARAWWQTAGAPSAAGLPPAAAGAQGQARRATASDGSPSSRAQPAAAGLMFTPRRLDARAVTGMDAGGLEGHAGMTHRAEAGTEGVARPARAPWPRTGAQAGTRLPVRGLGVAEERPALEDGGTASALEAPGAAPAAVGAAVAASTGVGEEHPAAEDGDGASAAAVEPEAAPAAVGAGAAGDAWVVEERAVAVDVGGSGAGESATVTAPAALSAGPDAAPTSEDRPVAVDTGGAAAVVGDPGTAPGALGEGAAEDTVEAEARPVVVDVGLVAADRGAAVGTAADGTAGRTGVAADRSVVVEGGGEPAGAERPVAAGGGAGDPAAVPATVVDGAVTSAPAPAAEGPGTAPARGGSDRGVGVAVNGGAASAAVESGTASVNAGGALGPGMGPAWVPDVADRPAGAVHGGDALARVGELGATRLPAGEGLACGSGGRPVSRGWWMEALRRRWGQDPYRMSRARARRGVCPRQMSRRPGDPAGRKGDRLEARACLRGPADALWRPTTRFGTKTKRGDDPQVRETAAARRHGIHVSVRRGRSRSRHVMPPKAEPPALRFRPGCHRSGKPPRHSERLRALPRCRPGGWWQHVGRRQHSPGCGVTGTTARWAVGTGAQPAPCRRPGHPAFPPRKCPHGRILRGPVPRARGRRPSRRGTGSSRHLAVGRRRVLWRAGRARCP